jgi:hypothetical protein
MKANHPSGPELPPESVQVIATRPRADSEDGSPTETERFIVEVLLRLDEADAEALHLKRALAHSRDIGAAVGVLMSRHKVTQDEAFQLLRRASQDHNRKLYDMAQDVIATGELPSPPS